MQGNPLGGSPVLHRWLAARPRGAGAGRMLVPLPPHRPPVLLLRTSASRMTAVGTPGDERGSSSPVPAREAKPPTTAGRQGCPLPPPASAAPLSSTGSAPGRAGRKHCTWKQNQGMEAPIHEAAASTQPQARGSRGTGRGCGGCQGPYARHSRAGRPPLGSAQSRQLPPTP